MEYLEFEKELEVLEKKREEIKEIGKKTKSDVKNLIKDINKKIIKEKKRITDNLTPWQRVQLSRHPQRPHTLDYINYLSNNSFIELHGDRNIKDDKAMIGGLGKIDKHSVMFIGQQKGSNTKMRQFRNFGMSNPDGYRKALRLMKMAEKFSIPIITLIDTPGAYPGIEAEERGQGEAIARNIFEMCKLKVPIMSIIIGEGASGGALGIGVGDIICMLENTWYSVISPESCSSILWRNWDNKETAAEALKLTPNNMLKNQMIDYIIKEPLGGAHMNKEKTFETLKDFILKHLPKLKKINSSKIVEKRIDKFCKMGIYKS
tara:strand:+ start:3766 stop:4719 length:954 start_codon:yes stop_codon:yes gene_type:complete